MSNELIILFLVSEGSITASTYPLAAAVYGFATASLYSSIFSFRFKFLSSASSISFLNIILAAPSGPITAISAVGHANTISAPSSLLHIAMYEPPYAFLVITVTFGTVASEYA